MAVSGAPLDVEKVPCEICLKEIPVSEAIIPEAVDYVVYFCGLECYVKWKEQDEKAKPRGGNAGRR